LRIYSRAYSEAGPVETVLLAALLAGLQELNSRTDTRTIYKNRFFIRSLLAKIRKCRQP
jgi:hypothetical protein